MRLFPEIFEKARKKEIHAEITSDTKVLNPFSSIILRFISNGNTLLEKETILKCDNLEECFFCFNQSYTFVILEKLIKENGRERKEKVSIPIQWKCLNWNGSPIFQDDFFDAVHLRGNKLILEKSNYLEVSFFHDIKVEKKKNLFRIAITTKTSGTNPYTKVVYTEQFDIEEQLSSFDLNGGEK